MFDMDPLARLRGWRFFGKYVSDQLHEMGPGVFVFCDDYQQTAEMAFYLDGQPKTYCAGPYFSDPKRLSQYDMWPDRRLDATSPLIGQNAIFIGKGSGLTPPDDIKNAFERVEKGTIIPYWINGVLVRNFKILPLLWIQGVPADRRAYKGPLTAMGMNRKYRCVWIVIAWTAAITLAAMLDRTVADAVHRAGTDSFLDAHSHLKYILKLPGFFPFTIGLSIGIGLLHPRNWRASVFLFLCGVTAGANQMIKFMAGRARPFRTTVGYSQLLDSVRFLTRFRAWRRRISVSPPGMPHWRLPRRRR